MRRPAAVNPRAEIRPAMVSLSFLARATAFTFLRRLSRGVALALLAAACEGGDPTQPQPQPQPQPSGSIGPEGGVVTSPDGRATLIVPPNALAASTALSVDVVWDGLDPRVVVGSVYSVNPTGIQFAVPATLTLPYEPSYGVSPFAGAGLRIHRLGSSGWTPDSASAVDLGTHTGAASITTAGTYGVRWLEPAGPCTDPGYRQFDFWLGAWKQSDDSSRTAEVTADANGCTIAEAFDNGSGYHLWAVMFYSPADQKWHGTAGNDWGFYEMSGTLEGGTMMLYFSATERYAWTPIDGEVRYVQERSYDGGKTWDLDFELTYVRR